MIFIGIALTLASSLELEALRTTRLLCAIE